MSTERENAPEQSRLMPPVGESYRRQRAYPLPLADIAPLLTAPPPVVLLDTARPGTHARFSYLFHSPLRTIEAHGIDDVPDALQLFDNTAQRYWLAGFISYEAGYALEERLGGATVRSIGGEQQPLLWFGVFDRPFVFDHHTGVWDRRPPCASAPADDRVDAGELSTELVDTLSYESYARYFATIRSLIERGDTYQVNYTFDKLVRTTASDFALYTGLRRAQPVPYGAYITTGDQVILSFSPELFFEQRGDRIRCKPMKGTAPRGRPGGVGEKAIRRGLAGDAKNRAENVMIVDLIRNDLGRICQTGSVRVPHLFDVETHPTLHQMTSTVTGRLRPDTHVSDIVRALFPCGSVTGAPKIRTMEIIRELEQGTRGAYCGAIGFSAPDRRAMFNIPIRTLQKRPGATDWCYRVGSGIVWDSEPESEWHECHTKTAFVTYPLPPFELVESLLWDGRLRHVRSHSERIARSAAQFGIPMTKRRFNELARHIAGELRGNDGRKVRIVLSPEGDLRWEAEPLGATPAATKSGMPTVAFSDTPIDSEHPLLYHKTTYRPWYADAVRRIRAEGVFDVLHRNTRGELTEGARSNVFVRLGGTLYTPPISCGILPGTLRSRMVRQGRCDECILTPDDLRRADAVYCGNAVRGLVEVRPAGAGQ